MENNERLLLSIPETCVALDCGRSTVLKLIAQGKIPVVRLGRAVRISKAALVQFIEQSQQAG